MTSGPPMSLPGTEPVTCPRCHHSVKYKSCPNCRLRLYCRACDVRLTDPLHQTACDVCGEPVEPGAGPGTAGPAVAAGPDAPPGSAVPASSAETSGTAVSVDVPASSGNDQVDEIIRSFNDAGAVRRQAASYAAALLAHNRLAEALSVLDDALASPGEQPGDAELLLLRGHSRQSFGQPLPALDDLLTSTEADPGLLAGAAPGLQRLLLSAGAGESRARILKSWGPALEPHVSSRDHLLLCMIELQAAVLQYDCAGAAAVVDRTRRVHGETGAAGCVDVLARIRLRAPADGRLFEALARTEVHLDRTEDAIADIDRAVQLGLGEPGARTALLEFKAGIVAGPGQDAQVARALREAGGSAYNENDSASAIRLLRTAWTMEPDAETGWYLADALRVRSTEDLANEDLLATALQVAEKAAGLAPMAGPLAWAHSVLAQIHLNLAAQEPLIGTRHLLLGAVGAERRLLFEDDPAVLAQLADAYRRLDWHALCADAARQSRGPLEDRPDVLWSLGYAELESGADPRATMDTLLRHPQITDLLRAAVYLVTDRKDEALAAFRANPGWLESEPTGRLLFGRLLRDMGRDSEARDEFEALREQAKAFPETMLTTAERAFASYALGDYAAALKLLQPALHAGHECSYEPTDVAGTAMLCHFALGDVAAGKTARDSLLADLRNVYDGNDLLTELDRLGGRPGQPPEVVAVVAESAELVKAAVARISQAGLDLDLALDRLRSRIDAYGRGGTADVGSKIAALASSRLLLQRNRWEDAANACLALLATGSEEPVCADALTGRLFTAVDQMARSGRGAAALAALERAASGVTSARRHEVVLRMVLVNLAEDRADSAQALAAEIQDLDGPTVATVLQAIAPDVEAMYRIAARAEQASLPGLDQALLRIAENALGLNLDEGTENVAPPVLVEIGEGMLAANPPPDGQLFRTELPALRDRVAQRAGVRLPGVLIRVVSDLRSDQFRVSVAGQWPELGRVQPGMVYVRRSKRRVVKVLGGACRVIPVTDPASGKEACWVSYERPPLWDRVSVFWKGTSSPPASDADWKKFIEDTGTWADPLSYPLSVLERHAMTRLSYVVIADEIAAAVGRWRETGGIDLDPQVIDASLGRLTALGHDLLDEGIALIPQPGSGAELERILDRAVPYPEALAAARDIFTTSLPPGGAL